MAFHKLTGKIVNFGNKILETQFYDTTGHKEENS